MDVKKVRINEKGQTQVNTGDGWQDCSSEEFDELLEAGYELEITCLETIN